MIGGPTHLVRIRGDDHDEVQIGERVRVAEGIAEVIAHAHSLGWRVGVFTGKGRRSAEFTLAGPWLQARIELLVSSDDVSRRKPDKEGVLRTSEALGVAASPSAGPKEVCPRCMTPVRRPSSSGV